MIFGPIKIAGVIMVGTLLGSFLGKFIGLYLPQGRIHDLFATGIKAGFPTTTMDLSALQLTFGCQFHLNMTSVAGIVIALFVLKALK